MKTLTYFKQFLKLEASGGFVLMAAALMAMLFANSPFAGAYTHLFSTPFPMSISGWGEAQSLAFWINDGLMAIFFFMIGMEIKRELVEGQLSSRDQALLPLFAALGGMLCPALIYAWFNWGNDAAIRGWAIPSATDIAFSLAVLSLFGNRLPVALKVFLTAIAVIDDLGAILIIALVYTQTLSVQALVFAAFCFAALIMLNRLGVRRMLPYLILGVLLWIGVLKSGVHATIAGVLLGLVIPLNVKTQSGQSMLRQMEHALHPWVVFAILPLFAFANAGIPLAGLSFKSLLEPVPLGIAAGLFLGKQLGIFSFTWLMIKCGFARMVEGGNWLRIYGIAAVGGIGFTMSLFIGGLAFNDESQMLQVRLGVIAGSLVSMLFGYVLLRISCTPKRHE